MVSQAWTRKLHSDWLGDGLPSLLLLLRRSFSCTTVSWRDLTADAKSHLEGEKQLLFPTRSALAGNNLEEKGVERP
jgi:hypothetical protein